MVPRRVRSSLLALFLLVLGLSTVVTADVEINWQPNPPVDSVDTYSVFRSNDLGLSVETYWWGITDTFYVDTPPKDRLYVYWIKAYNKHGSSPPSNTVSFWQSTNMLSVLSGELRLLSEYKNDSLEVRFSVTEPVLECVVQYDMIDEEFQGETDRIPGPGPWVVMIPVTDTLRVCVWSGEGGEELTVYAPIAVSPPEAPEIRITPFR